MLYLLILFPTTFVFLTALHTSCISCPSVAIWSSPTPPHNMFGIKLNPISSSNAIRKVKNDIDVF